MRGLLSMGLIVNRMDYVFQMIVVVYLLQGASTSARFTQAGATVVPWPRMEDIYRGHDAFHETEIFLSSRRVLASDNARISKNTTSNETEILLRFRRAVTRDPNGALDSWNATSRPNVCRWAGITCDSSGHVSLLNISNQQLEGSISPFLGQLSSLSSVVLSGNKFTGRIPSSFGKLWRLRYLDISRNILTSSIPPEITNCSSLIHLDLSANNLSGLIPKQLGNLRNISVVSLNQNSLIHSIPSELGNCSSLKYLDLSFNHLTGVIPHEVGRLRALSYLGLSSNVLTGSIPRSISNCTSLTFLDLSINNITGNIVPEVGELRKLRSLMLYSTSLGGSIPGSLGNLSSLAILILGCSPIIRSFITTCPLTGRIPPDLGRLRNLDLLALTLTNVSGSIPEELGNLSNITKMFISWNQLSGHIPPALGNLSTLLTMTIDGNQLEGTIPASLGGLENLGWIGVMSNQLTGPIPAEMGNLTKIYRLLLSHNRLSGPVISDLGRLSTLRELGLDYNQFSGELPSALGNCSLVGQLFLSFNNISGPLPIGMLVKMHALYNFSFSNNQLSGSIPNEIGDMKSLEYLNLSSNNLSGPIPAAFQDCKDLSTLDLSNNHLTGQLPIAALESLLHLEDFSVANNDLEGAIPGRVGAFVNITAVSYAGNTGLCGSLLGKNCSSDSTRRRQGNGFSWHKVWVYVGCGAAAGIFLAVFIVIILLRRRKHLRETDANDNNIKISDANDGSDNVAGFPKELKLTMNDLWIATAGFGQSNILGAGGQSTVYKAVLPCDDQMVFAVKRMRLDETTLALSSQGVHHEVRVLSNIKHRNLVKLHGWCASDKMMVLLMEYVPNGSLQLHLHSANNSRSIGRNGETGVGWLSLRTRIQIAIGVADGMAYLHHECHEPIIHNDLKPSNILLDDDFNAKVADFGIARFVQKGRLCKEATVSALYGTVGYIPPEYATSNKVTTTGDVYSYGVVVLELLTGKPPTDELFASGGTCLPDWVLKAFPDKIAQVLDKRLTSDFENNEEQIRWLFRVGLLCTRATPAERPSMQAVQQMLAEISEILTLKTFVSPSSSPGHR